MNSNQAIARRARIAADFLEAHADDLPELAQVKAYRGGISAQITASDEVEKRMLQVAQVLNAPVVITAYSHTDSYQATVTTSRDDVDVEVWSGYSSRGVMKLFLRLGIDLDTKIVELDAETLAKATAPTEEPVR